MFNKKLLGFITPVSLFIGSLLVYVHNLSASVYGGDVGDILTAAYVGGVPHPPGYPLFTFIGFILSHVLPFYTPAFAVGLISAFSGAAAVVLFFLTLRRLGINPFISIITTLTLGTNYLFWFYNEIAEVFALNTLFIILLFFLALCFYQTKKRLYFFLFLFFLGLSFTHHQTIIFFVPSFMLLVVPTLLKQRKQWKFFLWGILFFFVGLLPFLYIPIASSLHPALNWDNVHSISSFFHLVLRKDYGTFSAGGFAPVSLGERFIILKSYLQTMLFEITIPVCAIAFLGLIQGMRSKRLVSISLLMAFILAGPIFIFYAGFPLSQNFFFGVNERFFTMSAIISFYFFAFGLQEVCLLSLYFLKRPMYGILIPGIFLLIPFQLFFYNFPKTNLSQVWIGDTLGVDMLSPLPKNAVLILAGDTPLFNTQYMHYARHIRPDVDVVNFANMQMDPYVAKIQKKIIKATPSLSHQPPLLSIATVEMVAKSRPVYSAVQIQGGKKKLVWVSYGLYYMLLPEGDSFPTKGQFEQQTEKVWSMLHIPHDIDKAYGGLTISEIPHAYSSAALVVGAYIDSQFHDPHTALIWYKKALSIEPSNAKVRDVLGLYYLIDSKDCIEARDNFKNALQQDPSDELAYMLLYTTYRECFNDSKSANNLAIQFKNIFNEDIITALRKTLSNKGGLFQ